MNLYLSFNSSYLFYKHIFFLHRKPSELYCFQLCITGTIEKSAFVENIYNDMLLNSFVPVLIRQHNYLGAFFIIIIIITTRKLHGAEKNEVREYYNKIQ